MMGLLHFLNEDKNTRRIFGARELKIIEKQLFGVNLTQSEKNRLSRDIRKKLEFMREAARFESEFKLKKGAEINKLVEETKEIILSDVVFRKIKKIILYGSAAENKLTLQSDIDLAVEMDGTSLKDATLFRKRVLGRTSNKVDVQVYNCLPKKIKGEINARGKVIYAK